MKQQKHMQFFLTLVITSTILFSINSSNQNVVSTVKADATWDEVNETVDRALEDILERLDEIWGDVNYSIVILNNVSADTASILTRLDTISMGDTTSLLQKINLILTRIGGDEKWDASTLYGMQNYILSGLIDENNFYILHNGTLADPSGSSVLGVMIANQQAIATIVVDSSNNTIKAMNITKTSLTNKISNAEVSILNSMPGGMITVAVILIFIVLALLLWRFFFKNITSPGVEQNPKCFGNQKMYDQEKCSSCNQLADCKETILSSQSNPDCYGQNLKSDEECRICAVAEQCKIDTPVTSVDKQQQQPATILKASDPLEGF